LTLIIVIIIYRCNRIHDTQPISNRTLKEEYGPLFYDTPDDFSRRRVNLNRLPLIDDEGQEIPIFDSHGNQIPRTIPLIDKNESQCGVLINLQNIHALFNPDSQLHILDEDDEDVVPQESRFIHVDAYPLAFLKTAGNIQAAGVPHCFSHTITKINQRINRHSAQPLSDSDESDSSDHMSVDIEQYHHPVLSPGSSIVKPITSQFYNHIAHRTAAHAGKHYSQRGTVTAAVAGAFADANKDTKKAKQLQKSCKKSLPFQRFHKAISLEDCPSSCRAELVYSVDVRYLKDRSGR
jgi:hypothetical protein